MLSGDGLEFEDDREDYGEPHYVVYGFLYQHGVALVYTPRGEAYRIISMSKATPYEEAELYRYLRY